jgi:hypothetical protein
MADRPASSWASFWQGLSAPSLASCIGAFAIAALELVLCCVLVTPQRLAAIDSKILMENPHDDFARITLNALRMRYRPRDGLNVAYVGSSTARQALLHSESPGLIQDYLAAQLGERVSFHFLCTDAERLEEAIVLSDQLPPSFRGVVVVMVSDYRDEDRNRMLRERDGVKSPPARTGLALYSPDDDAFAASEGEPTAGKTGIYFLDFFPFFAVRRVVGARLYRVEPKHDGPAGGLTPQQQALLARRMVKVWDHVGRDYAARPKLALLNKDAPILEALVASWKAHGVTGILLEAPDNPKFDELKEGMREVYVREMPLFAARLGVEYWDLNPEVELKGTDFADHVHLFDRAARFKFQAAFVRRLAKFMKPMSRSTGQTEAGAPPATPSATGSADEQHD